MTIKPIPSNVIQSLVSYRPAFGKNVSKSLIRLSANENGIGCSPLVKEAVQNNDVALDRYPAQQDEGLINAIASRFGLNPTQILARPYNLYGLH